MRWVPIAALLLLAACAESDPYERAGMWQPTGANNRNLAAMVANPTDLLRGHGERGNAGWEATPPVTHLWAGHPAALPSGSSQSAPSPTPAAAAPGAN